MSPKGHKSLGLWPLVIEKGQAEVSPKGATLEKLQKVFMKLKDMKILNKNGPIYINKNKHKETT